MDGRTKMHFIPIPALERRRHYKPSKNALLPFLEKAPWSNPDE